MGDGEELSEDFILKFTGSSSLSSITTLDLHDIGLTSIDPQILNKMVLLEELDMSENKIKMFPESISLNKLRKLDCSDNLLSSIEFVKNFPKLEELDCEKNNLEASDRFIAQVINPNLKYVNSIPTDEKTINVYRTSLQPEVEGVWAAIFSENYKESIPAKELEKVTGDFIKRLHSGKVLGDTSLIKYRNFMLETLARELITKVQSGDFDQPPRKKSRRSMGQTTPPQPLQSSKTQSASKSSQQKSGTPSKRDTSLKHTIRVPDYNKCKKAAILSPLKDYDPIHFIRCHFGAKKGKDVTENDPTDDMTKVWGCQFEPDLNKKGDTTTIIATCGGNTVCLTDCNTGKVMKRYKEPGETFFALAWTTIEITNSAGKGRPTNILAVAGSEVKVKLLHPDQLVCYAEFFGCRKNIKHISFMVFHPVQSTWLFCGGSSGDINLWDIGIPQGNDYAAEPKCLLHLNSKEGGSVQSLSVDRSGSYLISGCDKGCFLWNIDQKTIFNRHKNKPTDIYTPNREIILPKVASEKMVDSVTFIDEDLVACKIAGQGCIQVFSLSEAFGTEEKYSILGKPKMFLEWSDTDEKFLNLGIGNGILSCGADHGAIFIYNLSNLKSKPMSKDQMVQASRVLEWPECILDNKKPNIKQMTDLLEDDEDIIVNTTASSSDKKYVVGVTDNNMVCIWKKID